MKKILLFVAVAILVSTTGFSQDTLNHYADAEIVKLVNYIKKLEGSTASYLKAHPNEAFVNDPSKSAEEKQELSDLLRDSTHRYNDAQIIKLAKYIKHLEKLDAENNAEIAAKKHIEDSLALASKNVNVSEQQEIDKLEKLIFFDFNSYVLKAESHKPLDDAAAILKKYSDLSFVIEGHTDNVGADAYNLNLSKERAKSVMNYLVSKGVSATKISSVGYGEAKPTATNDTEEGKAKNRRVEIKASRK